MSVCWINRRMQIRKQQAGFTLLEVMVAMFIFAGGLLGLSALQWSSLNYSQSAYYRSQASAAIYDIVDRMRINRTALTYGAYAAIDTQDSTPADPNCITSGCTAAQLASYDIREWSRLFKNIDNQAGYVPSLPSAYGTVTQLDGTLYRVTVNWMERGDEPMELSMNLRLVRQ